MVSRFPNASEIKMEVNGPKIPFKKAKSIK